MIPPPVIREMRAALDQGLGQSLAWALDDVFVIQARLCTARARPTSSLFITFASLPAAPALGALVTYRLKSSGLPSPLKHAA